MKSNKSKKKSTKKSTRQYTPHDELREMIIESSYKTVKEQGFDKLTIRTVTKNVGCAVGMPYKLFKNMDEIITEVNSITLDEIYKYIETSYNDKSSHIENIHNFANAYIKYSKENYNLWSMLFEYKISDKEQLPTEYKEKIERNFLFIERTIEDIKNDNSKKLNSNPKISARVLWTGIHGICILANSGKLEITNSDNTEILVSSLIDNYIKGLTS